MDSAPPSPPLAPSSQLACYSEWLKIEVALSLDQSLIDGGRGVGYFQGDSVLLLASLREGAADASLWRTITL